MVDDCRAVSDRCGAEIKPAPGAPAVRAESRPVSRLQRLFPARIDALAGVAAFAEDAGALAEFSRHDCLRLGLVLEELFTNTVEHGYGGDSDAPIRIACDAERGRVTVTYEDSAPRFDPLAALPPPGMAPAAGQTAPGQLGLVLIARMAARMEYERAGNRNRISLVVVASG